jgi:iron complex outermembrane recepter protein
MAHHGECLRASVRFATLAVLGTVCISTGPVSASPARDFTIGPGLLGTVLIEFGRQSGLNIGVTDSLLAGKPSSGVQGRHSVKAALRIVLRRTGADFVFVDPMTVRIVAARRAIFPVRAPVQNIAPTVLLPPKDIVVTASKQRTPLANFAATATVIDLNDDWRGRDAAQGTAALVARLPMLASTELGAGRNKLFIRGVADSSFNGGSQATVGQYLGDARLTYNAPDPDLNLYDIGRIEIVEGPQGALYGTGSIGGIVRLVPNPPDSRHASASLAAGWIGTNHGDAGGDGAGMVNLPVIRDRLALRGVAYATVDAGYINDPSRELTNINRTQIEGGRFTLRWLFDGPWTVDAGLVVQNIRSRDGQYALRGGTDLARASRIAQPFGNDYRMAFVTLTQASGDSTITSTTAIVRHNVATTFDATGFDGTSTTARFNENIDITLASHETRVSGGSARSPWLGGISGVYDISRVTRAVGNPVAPSPISGVNNENAEIALFGQYELRAAERLRLTLGGRATFARSVGRPIDDPRGNLIEPTRNTLRISPSLALAWQPTERLLVFARFQHGARAGGLAVSATGSTLNETRFESDTLMAGELGIRFGDHNRDRIWASATLSYARWTDIQADLIDSKGFPYTANIGDGQISGFEAQGGWAPLRNLRVDGAVFVNISALTAPTRPFAAALERELPNIAPAGARAGLRYTVDLAPCTVLTLDASLRYVGTSQLGIGEPFELAQGNYTTEKIGIRVGWRDVGLSIDVDNIGNVRGNRFAFGNPFGLMAGNQITPLRPRNVRIGVDARF